MEAADESEDQDRGGWDFESRRNVCGFPFPPLDLKESIKLTSRSASVAVIIRMPTLPHYRDYEFLSESFSPRSGCLDHLFMTAKWPDGIDGPWLIYPPFFFFSFPL